MDNSTINQKGKFIMKDIAKNIIDNVFSFGFFLFVAGLGAVYLLIASSEQEQARNAACLKAGMVQVRTDGGNFCVAPTNLVELK